MEPSQQVYDAGQEVASASAPTLAEVLNHALGRFVGWPFKAAPGYAVDRDGTKTEAFTSVVHTPSARAVREGIPADTVAAIIDARENMDLEQFRAAYRRTAQAKALKKSPAPDLGAVPNSTITLGIIFALQSAAPLEILAEELDRLNADTPSHQWPDMVAVASTGTLNYAVQFPGQAVSADFLPPAEGALAAYTPPMYIIMVMRPTGAYTFNKMMSFLIAHLSIFSPGANLPNFAQIQQGVPTHGVVISGYQYDLSGRLLPVPRHLYNDRYIAALPIRIEDGQGNLLSTLQFVPWQDGGVILLKGALPLAPLLVLLGKEALRANIVTLPGVQISSVLPITRTRFNELLTRIQQQTNMIVRADPTKVVLQKVSDEGTQSPFIARLLMGILRLRDAAFGDPAERDKFDKTYDFVISELLNARTTAQGIVQMWRDHARKVTSGEVARSQGNTIQVNESIDKGLRKEVEGFLNSAVRALKQGMQTLASDLGVEIGFLFKKQAAFDRGLAALRRTNPLLAEYLRQTRVVWSERLLERRNAIEHEGWMLPRVTYADTDAGIQASEPLISDMPVSEFVRSMLDRLACFVEEVAAHSLQARLPPGINITEIPVARRVAEAPERFCVTLAKGGMPAWGIVFHSSSLEET